VDKTTPDNWKYGATAHGAVIDAQQSLVRGDACSLEGGKPVILAGYATVWLPPCAR